MSDLQQYLDSALQGQRQVVFVTGEPGIGKTTLIQAFLDQISVRGDLLIGQGQCIDHYGTGEGYLPVLDALGQALRGSEGERLLRLLGRYAPTWLTHLPAFLSATDMEAIQRKTQGATRERMLREIAEALEALTAEQLLVFVLEDLHWSDASTVDLLSFVARRRQSARLLIIGTYRPDMIVREHPLRRVKQELQAHDLCREVAVHLLSAHDVDEYLTQRFPHNQFSQTFAEALYRRTDGNPLFLMNLLQDWIARGIVRSDENGWRLTGTVEEVSQTIPQNLRELIEQQLSRLTPPEQELLETASVVGEEFPVALIAAGATGTVVEIEEVCLNLSRRETFLTTCGTVDWPDGTASSRYCFLHGLYQQVLYEHISSGRRIQLHRAIGNYLESQ